MELRPGGRGGRFGRGSDGIAGEPEPTALWPGATTDDLDRVVVPAATRAANGLDPASGRLEADARQLAQMAWQSAPELKPLREVHDGLARFDEDPGSLQTTRGPRRLAALRQAIARAKGVVAETARLADRATRS